LARPGGNVTGVSLLITELDAKRLEVLKQLVPSGRRFGVLNDPAVSTPTGLEAISQTARALGVEIVTVEVRNPNEIPAAIHPSARQRSMVSMFFRPPCSMGYGSSLDRCC
jgi:putative ABC transport system substrate-binding protein